MKKILNYVTARMVVDVRVRRIGACGISAALRHIGIEVILYRQEASRGDYVNMEFGRTRKSEVFNLVCDIVGIILY